MSESTCIVIVTHNQLEYTRACVASVRRWTPEPYRFVFVDNGSTDGTGDWLDTVDGATVIRNPTNAGFPAGANQGLRQAHDSEHVLLLNNDTLVTFGWLGEMLAVLRAAPRVGLVGPASNNVSGVQRVDAWYSDATGLRKFAETHHRAGTGVWEEVTRLVGFCLLVRRGLFPEVGELDELYTPGNFEDDDLCLRCRLRGYRCAFARGSFVHHFGSVSFGRNRDGYAALMKRNGTAFAAKWTSARVEQEAASAKASPLLSVVIPAVGGDELVARTAAAASAWSPDVVIPCHRGSDRFCLPRARCVLARGAECLGDLIELGLRHVAGAWAVKLLPGEAAAPQLAERWLHVVSKWPGPVILRVACRPGGGLPVVTQSRLLSCVSGLRWVGRSGVGVENGCLGRVGTLDAAWQGEQDQVRELPASSQRGRGVAAIELHWLLRDLWERPHDLELLRWGWVRAAALARRRVAAELRSRLELLECHETGVGAN